MSLNKISLAGNNLFTSRESLVIDIPAGDEKIANLFYSVLKPRLPQPQPHHNQYHQKCHPRHIKLCYVNLSCSVMYHIKTKPKFYKRAWHMATKPLTFSVLRRNPWTLAKKWLKTHLSRKPAFPPIFFNNGWKDNLPLLKDNLSPLLKTAAHAQWMWSRLRMCSIDLYKKVAHRRSKRDVVYLGWPIAPLYSIWAQMRGGRIAGSQPMSKQLWTWSPNYGDLTPLTYGGSAVFKDCPIGGNMSRKGTFSLYTLQKNVTWSSKPYRI